MDFLRQLQSEWAVIGQAPFTFSLALVGAFLLAYLVARWRYDGQVANLNTMIRLRDSEIADWKRKTEGATPEDVRERILALEAAQRGRRLTQEQSETIARVAKHPGVEGDLVAIYVHNLMSVPDASKYARDLRRAFANAGWRVSGSNLVSGNEEGPGLIVSVDDPESQSPGQRAVFASLRAANVPFSIKKSSERLGSIWMVVGDPDDGD